MKTSAKLAQRRGQFPLKTDWHDTVFTMRMAGKRTGEICTATGYTHGGVGKVIAMFRARGIVFPPVEDGSPMSGIKADDRPNAIRMQHAAGTMPNGNFRRCHSQNRDDAIRGIECDGGALNG